MLFTMLAMAVVGILRFLVEFIVAVYYIAWKVLEFVGTRTARWVREQYAKRR